MTDTTLFLLLIGIVFVTIALVGTMNIGQLGALGTTISQGVRGALAWVGTGLATYGLVFGYTGAAAPFLSNARAEREKAQAMRIDNDRSIATQAARVFGAP